MQTQKELSEYVHFGNSAQTYFQLAQTGPLLLTQLNVFNCHLSFGQFRTDLDKIFKSWEALIVTSEPSQPVQQLFLIKVSKLRFIFTIGSNQKCRL